MSLRYIKETIRLARYPMTMIFLEGADVRCVARAPERSVAHKLRSDR